jgi:type II secretory pathway component GspD/PulD (secretin)
MGGGGGGMGGGGGGNMVGNWQSRYRGYELANTITQTIAPESWDPDFSNVGTGIGRITPFGDNQLVIYQTPEIHELIRKFLEELSKNLGQQIAIEARFLLVDENYLKDVGLDVDIARLKIGGNIYGGGSSEKGVLTNINQTSAGDYNFTTGTSTSGISAPSKTSIPGSLAGATYNPALQMGFTYGGPLDDLQVDFMIKATQIHQNSKQLTAPKAMVLSGESATLRVFTTKSLRTGATLNSSSVAGVGGGAALYYIDDTYTSYSSGVQLSITPTISSDRKYVLLRITTYLMDVDASSTETQILGYNTAGTAMSRVIYFPSQEISSIQTRVSVPDRGTVLLGGQTLTASREKEAGVPILSKIPLFGRLFSNSTVVRDKRILLILVKPTIVLKEEAEADAIAAMK